MRQFHALQSRTAEKGSHFYPFNSFRKEQPFQFCAVCKGLCSYGCHRLSLILCRNHNGLCLSCIFYDGISLSCLPENKLCRCPAAPERWADLYSFYGKALVVAVIALALYIKRFSFAAEVKLVWLYALWLLVSRMLNSIGKDQIIRFLDDWNKGRDHKQQIYISYDSTNKNCQAGDMDLVEFGKAKDDKGLPVFNISLVFDKTNRIPLLYEEYPGSINDVSQFNFMVDKVIEYGYTHIGFILDRGYFSKDNIRYMEENNFSFIMMIKGRKELVSTLVDQHRNTFETIRSCSIRSYRVYGKTVQAKLYEDDTRNRYIHIYFNPSKQAAEREQFEQQIEKYRLFLEKHINTDTKFSLNCHRYFNLVYNKKEILISVSEREDVIEQQLRLCGYFCIVTSEEMTAASALIQYKGRDISEKLFRSDKTFLGSGSMRTHTAQAMSAKLFFEFVALIVRNRIYNLLKETMLRLQTKQTYMNVPKAIRELEKIEMVRCNNGRYRLDHAVTRRQKTILSAFGLSDKDVFQSAGEISKLLANSQSLNSESDTAEDCQNQNEEDNLYGEDEIDLYD